MGFKLDLKTGLILFVAAMLLFPNLRATVLGLVQGTGGGTTIISGGGGTPSITVDVPVEDVTVTFSSWDAFNEGTSAGSGHRALLFNGLKSVEINDDGTKTASPGDPYLVLLGNLTTTLGSVENYYPTLKEGTIGKKGTDSISGGQYRLDRTPTFTYWNDNAQANTATQLDAGETGEWELRFKATTDRCVGNKDAADQKGATNILCLKYNNTLMKSPKLKDRTSGTDVPTASRPTQINTNSDWSLACYESKIICDGAIVEYSVSVEPKTTSSNPAEGDNITISLSDGTYDYNAYTNALIVGVEDEDGNDIGFLDLNKNASLPRDNSYVLPVT